MCPPLSPCSNPPDWSEQQHSEYQQGMGVHGTTLQRRPDKTAAGRTPPGPCHRTTRRRSARANKGVRVENSTGSKRKRALNPRPHRLAWHEQCSCSGSIAGLRSFASFLSPATDGHAGCPRPPTPPIQTRASELRAQRFVLNPPHSKAAEGHRIILRRRQRCSKRQDPRKIQGKFPSVRATNPGSLWLGTEAAPFPKIMGSGTGGQAMAVNNAVTGFQDDHASILRPKPKNHTKTPGSGANRRFLEILGLRVSLSSIN